MDGFAYLPASPLPSGAAPHEVPVMSDWEWLFETTFHGVYGFDVLEETVQTVKDALGEDYKDYKVQVYVSILTISNATDNFGDVDGDGDVLTMLKSEVHLKDWETRNGRIPRTFKFYKILKTFTDSPEVEPFPMGYIIESKE